MINLELLLQTLDFKKCDQLSYLVTEQNLEMLSHLKNVTKNIKLVVKLTKWGPPFLRFCNIFSRESDSTFTNVIYPFVCLSSKPLNSLKSSSFILHPSSFFIYPESFFIILPSLMCSSTRPNPLRSFDFWVPLLSN